MSVLSFSVFRDVTWSLRIQQPLLSTHYWKIILLISSILTTHTKQSHVEWYLNWPTPSFIFMLAVSLVATFPNCSKFHLSDWLKIFLSCFLSLFFLSFLLLWIRHSHHNQAQKQGLWKMFHSNISLVGNVFTLGSEKRQRVIFFHINFINYNEALCDVYIVYIIYIDIEYYYNTHYDEVFLFRWQYDSFMK